MSGSWALNIVRNSLKAETELVLRKEREKNWLEYPSRDGSMIISYEIVDHSYDDEFGRVEKHCVEIRKVMADVTLDENYSGLIEDLRIEIEAQEND